MVQTVVVGDRVTIDLKVSAYHGVPGVVIEIDAVASYAVVCLPKGTELRLEGISKNKILSEVKTRKRREQRWGHLQPVGDPPVVSDRMAAGRRRQRVYAATFAGQVNRWWIR